MNNTRNLAIPFPTFGGVPFEDCENALEQVGLKKSPYNLVLYRLFGFLDWSKTVRIGVHDFMEGWTCVFSEDTLGKKLGISGRTARKALHALVDEGILESEKVGKCFRYQIALFKSALAELKENPPETIKVAYLKAKESLEDLTAEVKHTTRNNRPSMSENSSPIPEKFSDNQESYKINQDSSSTTSLDTSTGIADDTPNDGEVEENIDLTPEPDPPDAAAKLPEEAKTSQREKPNFPFDQPSLALADQFAGPEARYTDVDSRNECAQQFSEFLLEMFRDSAVVDLYPDDAERLEACAEVLRIWIKTVQAYDNPAFSVGYMKTRRGKDALAKAKLKVFDSQRLKQKWADGELETNQFGTDAAGPVNRMIFHFDEASTEMQAILMQHVPELCKQGSFCLDDVSKHLRIMCEINAPGAIRPAPLWKLT